DPEHPAYPETVEKTATRTLWKLADLSHNRIIRCTIMQDDYPTLLAAPVPPPEPIAKVMDVEEQIDAENGVRVYRGQLREPAMDAFRDLKNALPPNIVPMIRADRDRIAIVLMPRVVEEARMERRSSGFVPLLLFFATLVTTTVAGAAQSGVNLLRHPEQFTAGLPYALALMAILGTHELGHYFAARYHRQNVTLPYFIPAPFSLGTFGAFIRMKSPPENRIALFDVAVAGPLAGLVMAIPALYFGLQSSEIVSRTSLETLQGTMRPSIAMSYLIHTTLGDAIKTGDVLRLSPMAFAGWLGLLLTGLNLMPIGQLDGGHTARAMFGTRVGTYISYLAMALLAFAAFTVAPHLMFWAFIVFLMGARGVPPLNDVTPVTPGRFAIGVMTFAIFVLIMIPAF
ncbi:MAG TPA: site-2 protease family protein, partial [Bryobacteraceae bacterium]|nr:site-2 protease family protein [Bryobacteraceae bacterium]